MGFTIQLLYMLVLMICYSKINWQLSKIYWIQSVLGRSVRRQELRDFYFQCSSQLKNLCSYSFQCSPRQKNLCRYNFQCSSRQKNLRSCDFQCSSRQKNLYSYNFQCSSQQKNLQMFLLHAHTPVEETRMVCSLQAGLQLLHDITLKSEHININSLPNKITDLITFIRNVQFNYFVLSQTKLINNFTPAQFVLSGMTLRRERIWIEMRVVFMCCLRCLYDF